MVDILLVDDHTIFREGLKAILQKAPELRIVGEADDGDAAITKAQELRPEVILMDVNMPFDGLRATVEILKRMPDAKILMLTISERDDNLREALKAGALGYMLKGASVEQLVAAIKSVAAGAVVFTPAMAGKMLHDSGTSLTPSRRYAGLTQREDEILRQVAEGASNKEIAIKLCVSEPTVKSHLRNIMDKLEVNNRTQAAAKALNAGLLKR